MVVAGYTVLFTLAGGLSFLAARIYDVLGEKPARPGNGVPAAGRVAPAPAVAPTPAAVWSVATLEQPKLRAPLEVRVEDEDEDTHTDDLENPF